MKVSFRSTGGFAGLARSFELDLEAPETGGLEPAEIEELKALLPQTPVPQPPESGFLGGGDVEQIEIALPCGDTSTTLRFPRNAVPRQLKPLVDFLSKHAKIERRR